MLMFRTLLVYIICFFGIYAAVLFFISFFDNKNMKTFNASRPEYEKLPLISLIIPVFNGEKALRKTILNALHLEYPKDKIEIIVVDDGSTDKSYKIAESFAKQGIKACRLGENLGKGAALNLGIKRSSGQLIANLDADSFLDRDALLKMAGFFENPHVMAVTPSVKIWGPKNIVQKIQFVEFLSTAIVRKVFSYLGGVPIISGASTLFRKDFFEKHGGFLENTLTEDVEMSLRIENKGYITESAMDVSVYTCGALTFRIFFSQRLRWFKGLIDSLMIHRDLFRPSKGNVAVMILPLSLLAIVLAMTATAYALVKFTQIAAQNFINFYLVGFDMSQWFDINFDVYSIDVGATMILPLVLILFSIILIYLCRKYSNERQRIVEPYLLFILSYWLIAAMCWASALIYKIAGKKIRWGNRHI